VLAVLVFAVEVGCQGFVGKSTVNVLKRLGSNGRRLRSVESLRVQRRDALLGSGIAA